MQTIGESMYLLIKKDPISLMDIRESGARRAPI
jgi:hypothetical protein